MEKPVFQVYCAECHNGYDQEGYKPTKCGACGSSFIAVREYPPPFSKSLSGSRKLTRADVERVVWALVKDGWLMRNHVNAATDGAVSKLDT